MLESESFDLSKPSFQFQKLLKLKRDPKNAEIISVTFYFLLKLMSERLVDRIDQASNC